MRGCYAEKAPQWLDVDLHEVARSKLILRNQKIYYKIAYTKTTGKPAIHMASPHALVFGASGISGYALCNLLLQYPNSTTFSKVTGLTNRPINRADWLIPEDSRLQIASGIDLTKPVTEVVAVLREKVADIQTVTHVYFTAYIQTPDFDSLREVNTTIIRTAILAVEETCPDLETVILQTGGKGYGFEFPEIVSIKPPMQEANPRIPDPYDKNIFYYTQYDFLASQSKGKRWTFTETRPDGIIGYVPGKNFMNLAQGIAIYLSLKKLVDGDGTIVPFPGSEKSWLCKHSDTHQDVLARMEIFASLHTEECGQGQSFNCANEDEPVQWKDVWPRLCAYFGLNGSGPDSKALPVEEFVKLNKGRLVSANGFKREDVVAAQNWPFVHFMLVQSDFDRWYSLEKARSIGFTDKIDTAESYIRSFEKMRKVYIIPGPPVCVYG